MTASQMPALRKGARGKWPRIAAPVLMPALVVLAGMSARFQDDPQVIGVVTDPSGAAVEGAVVDIYPQTGLPPFGRAFTAISKKTFASGEEGKVAIADLPYSRNREYIAVVQKAGLAILITSVVASDLPAPPYVWKLGVGRRITVLVQNEAGEPIEGADVYLTDVGGEFPARSYALQDAGVYILDDVEKFAARTYAEDEPSPLLLGRSSSEGLLRFTSGPNREFSLGVTRPGYAPQVAEVEFPGLPGGSMKVDLLPGGRVDGIVVDKQGLPQAGVRVLAMRNTHSTHFEHLYGAVDTALTDGSGRFSLISLPRKGPFRIVCVGERNAYLSPVTVADNGSEVRIATTGPTWIGGLVVDREGIPVDELRIKFSLTKLAISKEAVFAGKAWLEGLEEKGEFWLTPADLEFRYLGYPGAFSETGRFESDGGGRFHPGVYSIEISAPDGPSAHLEDVWVSADTELGELVLEQE